MATEKWAGNYFSLSIYIFFLLKSKSTENECFTGPKLQNTQLRSPSALLVKFKTEVNKDLYCGLYLARRKEPQLEFQVPSWNMIIVSAFYILEIQWSQRLGSQNILLAMAATEAMFVALVLMFNHFQGLPPR